MCQSNVSGWNYNYTFYAGNTYRIPYGQPINSGYYIGYGVSVDDFMNSANTYGSVYYNSRSTYGSTSSVYYATDCSAFVSWCWGVDRKTTYSIPQISTYMGMATASNAYSLQLGDCLNSYVLNDSYIDNNVYFDRLDAGEYTYVIQATYSNYYAKTTKELGVYNSTRTLKKVYFTVTP